MQECDPLFFIEMLFERLAVSWTISEIETGRRSEGIFFAGLKHVAIKVIASYTEDQIITSDPSQVLALRKERGTAYNPPAEAPIAQPAPPAQA